MGLRAERGPLGYRAGDFPKILPAGRSGVLELQSSTARAAACIRSVRRTGMHAIATLIADPTCVAAITPSRALPISGAYGP